jgi:sugar lactone lactonase YvrE/putative hemolysin
MTEVLRANRMHSVTWQASGCLSLCLLAALVAALLNPLPATAATASKPSAFEVQSYQKDFEVSVQAAEHNLAVQDRGASIVEQLEHSQGKRYAGVWFDNESGEFVVPTLTGHTSVADALRGTDLGENFRTKAVLYSWEELEAAHERIDEALLPLFEESVVQTFLDPRTNAVVIAEAEGTSKAQGAKIQHAVKSENVLVEVRPRKVGRFDPEVTACNASSHACGTPLRGGVAIGRDEAGFQGICTAGFKAIGNVEGNRFMLTAGHCVKEPDIPYWKAQDENGGGHYMGFVQKASWPGGDYAAINSNGTYWDVSWPSMVAFWGTDQTYSISAESSSYLGEWICHSGKTTNGSCGYVSALDKTVPYVIQESPLIVQTVYHLTEFNSGCVSNGDSGGPVFTGGGHTALGIMSGKGEDGSSYPNCEREDGYYVEITEVTDALAVTVAPRVGAPPVAHTSDQGVLAFDTRQATLGGTVDPNGLPTTYHFEYGMTAGYGSSTANVSAGSGWQPTPVTGTLTGLQGLSGYHFRVVASNSAGTSYGLDQVFGTPDWRPIVTTEPATEEGKTATLKAKVDGRGIPTHYHFEYGPEGFAYEGSTPDVEISGSGEVVVEQKVSGLYDGQKRYRIVASNEDGISYGSDRFFEIHHRPLVKFEGVSSLTTGSATITATVDPQDFDTKCWVRYWTSATQRLNTAAVPIQGTAPPTQVSIALDELQQEKIYPFRFVCFNSWGTGESNSLSFTTPGIASSYESSFGTEGSGDGQLKQPLGLAIDTEGDIWVADSANNRIEEFNPEGKFLAKFGAKGTADGQFEIPTDLAFDKEGNIWVTDSGNDRLQKFNPEGKFLAKFGSPGTEAGKFTYPARLAIDAAGNIWVADDSYYRLEEFTSSGSFVREVHGAGRGGSGPAEFAQPSGIAIDSEGNLWVADRGNNRIQKLDSTGAFIAAYGSKGSADGKFETPAAVALRPSGHLLVTDRVTGRVQQLDRSGAYVNQFGAGQLHEPEGIAVADNGTVYVANSHDNRIEKWRQPIPEVKTGSVTGIKPHQATLHGTINPHGIPTSYRFEYRLSESESWAKAPVPNASSGAGTTIIEVSALITDYSSEAAYRYRLVATNANGTSVGKELSFEAPPSTPVYAFSFGAKGKGQGQFERPLGLDAGPYGDIWVADSGNDRVQEFNLDGNYIAQIGSTGSSGGQFKNPTDVGIDGGGQLWVADSGNSRVQNLDREGKLIQQVGSPGTAPGQFAPGSLRIVSGPSAYRWVSDSKGRIQSFTSSGSFVREVHGAGYGGTGPGELLNPADMTFDSTQGNSKIWVADRGNNRIQAFTPVEGTYYAGFGKKGTGNGELEAPSAIETTGNQDFLVSDKTGRVQQLTPAGKYVTQFGAGKLTEPEGLLNVSGRIYVTDAAANQVQVWVYPAPPKVTTLEATDAASKKAVLHASIDPEGLSTTYRFEYGPTTAYGSSTATKSAGAGVSPGEVSEAISGLSPSTTYHFRIVAENSEGISYGNDGEFKTSNGLPLAISANATGLTSTKATLNGTVNPAGFATTYRFEYGPTTAYGTSVPVPNEAVGSGEDDVKVSKAISGLTANTQYHFRLVATNEKGTTYGKDLTLTTDAWSTQTTFGLTPKTEVKLETVSCPAATMCMAAGRDNYSGSALSEIWNGSGWSVTNRIIGTIESISCPSATWCMAAGGTRSFRLQQEGSVWNYEIYSPPTPAGGSELKLSDISCTSSEACTAVGSYYNGTRTATLGERWNGSSWSLQSTTSPASGATELLGVSCPSATSCMASGRNAGVTFAEAWNGTSWSTSSTSNPAGATESRLSDIACNSASACTAVGFFKEGGWKKALAERFNGTTWSIQTTPAPAGASGNIALEDIACPTTTACTAAGTYGIEKGTTAGEDLKTKTLAEAWNGSTWSAQSSPNNSEKKFNGLAGVACSSTSACSAVGSAGPSSSWADGTVTSGARYNGSAWSTQTTFGLTPKTEVKLETVSCPAATMCMAAGRDNYSGSALSEIWNGSGWSVTNRIIGTIESISCPSATWCMAAGGTRSFRLQQEGSVWNYEIYSPPTPAGGSELKLSDISCTSSEACTAVGSYYNGTRTATLGERWNGSSWSLQSTTSLASVSTELLGVSCPSASFCVAVGHGGGAVSGAVYGETWNGTSWSASVPLNPSAAESGLLDVACSSMTSCMTVGWSSNGAWKAPVSERFNGGSWTVLTTPSPGTPETVGNVYLQDISCPSSTSCAAAGQYGSEREAGAPGNDTATKTLTESWNGSAWSVQASPNSEGKSFNGLAGVSCSAVGACSAVGSAGPSSSWADGTVTLGERYG